MRVEIRNLGVIEEKASIDLKPLTVLIGPNNSGKTWLAYSLAGILGPFGWNEYAQAIAEKKVANSYEQIEIAIARVLEKRNATIDLLRFADEYGEDFFNAVAQYAPNWMHRFFRTQLAHFDGMEISLRLGETKPDFLNRVSRYARTNRVAGSILTIRKARGEDKVFALTSTEVQDTEGQEELLEETIPPEEVRERLISFISTVLRQSLYPQIRVFPTERTTLVTLRFAERVADRVQPVINERVMEALEVLAKELDMSELVEQNRAVRTTTWPVSSFMGMLHEIFNKRFLDREVRDRQALRDPNINRYTQLAEILENEVLTGSVYLSTPEADPGREVLFQATQDINLEIPIVSSMVKELAPLILYLRHLARPGELLIIDEPEMNLHPAAQVKIVEFLAMLVNAGLHVLITTHSTYVVDHLSNLMNAYERNDQDEIEKKFLLEEKEAFISQEKVSVYSVEDGKVKNILEQQGIINWKTFSDVTKYVERVHFELLGE